MSSPNLGPIDLIGRLQQLNEPYPIAYTHWIELDTSTLHADFSVGDTLEYYISTDGYAHLRGSVTSSGGDGITLTGGGETLITLPEEIWTQTTSYIRAYGQNDAVTRFLTPINPDGTITIPYSFGGTFSFLPGYGSFYYPGGNTIKFHGTVWRVWQEDELDDFVE